MRPYFNACKLKEGPMNSMIEVKNLTKDYGFNRGVFDISFHIEKGEVFGFLGPNGAGKSTTVRHLMGFSKPDKGDTTIYQMSTFENYDKILKHVGYIPGELALPNGLTGKAFIRHVEDLTKYKNPERQKMLLDKFELSNKELSLPTKQMSLGSKRKLVIVSAFMHDPDIYILDEPTSGLDPFMQDVFIELIKEEKKREKTILFSSHIFNEIDAKCDRISIIKDGRIVSSFNAHDFKHNQDKLYELTFKNQSDYLTLLKSKNEWITIVDITPVDFKIIVGVNDQHINELIDLLKNLDILHFHHMKETLESYFLSFYSEDKNFGGIE